jgi:DNA-binding CsgD family transcriptional regulator
LARPDRNRDKKSNKKSRNPDNSKKSSKKSIKASSYLDQPVLVLQIDPHGCSEDFSALTKQGFSAREIETLSYLPLGYTNRQIAMAMGITVDGVKKHLKNLGRKLEATGRSEILYRALWLKKRGARFKTCLQRIGIRIKALGRGLPLPEGTRPDHGHGDALASR